MISPLLISGFTLGLLGSLHCVGMCGPLALALPIQQAQGLKRTVSILIYQLGRISSYGVLGLLFSVLGRQFVLFGYQQLLSITIGGLMVLSVCFMFFHKQLLSQNWIKKYWNQKIIRLLTPLFKKKNISSLFFIGILNGLLPCGLVYMAIAAALNMGGIYEGMLFMILFGLGTLPAMFLITYAGKYISIGIRTKLKHLTPILMGVMGFLLIIRGLDLNIPYLSPKVIAQKVSCCHPKN